MGSVKVSESGGVDERQQTEAGPFSASGGPGLTTLPWYLVCSRCQRKSGLSADLRIGSGAHCGAVMDPTNAANAPTITANIERSFRAFEDDNRDGLPDPA